MDANFFLSPPVSFVIFLVLSFCLSFFFKKIAARGTPSKGKLKAYACGEDMDQNQGQPDYSDFFQFAFFFTIMHVVVLVVATDPVGLSFISMLYLGITVLSLFMLLRREKHGAH